MQQGKTKEEANRPLSVAAMEACPFCGGEPHIGGGPNYAFVNCVDCLASTNLLLATEHQPTEAEAIAAWNTRRPTVPDKIAALTALLREARGHMHRCIPAVGNSYDDVEAYRDFLNNLDTILNKREDDNATG